MMEDSIIALAAEYDMLPRGKRVLCAVSGGRDSMCLLWALKSLEEEMGFSLSAAHYDHKIRAESGEDAAFVRSFCEANGIELFSGSGDVPAWAKEKTLGLEEAARELRYAFLEKTAAENGFDRIATAHNADDNVETVIMNLVRGSGLRGMAGIPPRRGIIVRPLLGVPRAEIDAYIAECRLPFVEDKTNADETYTRNRIRRQIVPILKQMNPGLCRTVTDTTSLLRADAGCLDAMAFSFIEKAGGDMRFSALQRLPVAVKSRVVRQLAKNAGAGSISRQKTLSVLALPPQGSVDIGAGVTARLEYDRLTVEKPEGAAPTFDPVSLSVGSSAVIPELGVEVFCSAAAEGEKIHSSLTTFFFKNASICGNIIIRPRRAGDTLRIRAGKGRTLKKLFIDAKLPKSRRGLIPVAADDRGVLGVFGFGQDMRGAPDGEGPLVKIEIKERKSPV